MRINDVPDASAQRYSCSTKADTAWSQNRQRIEREPGPLFTLFSTRNWLGGAHIVPPMDKLDYERTDYSVVVKNRAPPPKAWRWEIYRAGNANPIKQSAIYFDTTAAARRAGKDALNQLLNKLFT
jgi:hypothetical protein